MGVTRAATDRPNLVFVFADQMRGMDVGCAGNSQVLTPNLDRLAASGFRFSNAVSCFPVCTPYRGCLISGRYPTTTGVLDNDVPLPIDGKGFGHALKAAGYRTGWVGKWHLLGPTAYRRSFIPAGEHRHGFDDLWAGLNCGHQYLDGFYYLNDDPNPVWFQGYEPEVQTEIGLDFISTHRDEPFALFLSWGPPHDPYHQIPERWQQLYDPAELRFRPNVPAGKLTMPCLPGNCKPVDKDMTPAEVEAWFRRHPALREEPDPVMVRDYYAAISALDFYLGRVLDHLDACGLADNTVVVFTSDHGDMLFSQGAFQKNHPWEESINVPFLVRFPGQIAAGGTSNRPFNTPDIMPTLIDLLGVPVPDYCEGTSFAPLLRGFPQATPEAAYIMCTWEWNLPVWRGVRTEQHTYVESLDGPILLYDNTADLYQLHNLVGTVGPLQQKLRNQCLALADRYRILFEPWPVTRRRLDEVNRAWVVRHGATIQPRP